MGTPNQILPKFVKQAHEKKKFYTTVSGIRVISIFPFLAAVVNFVNYNMILWYRII